MSGPNRFEPPFAFQGSIVKQMAVDKNFRINDANVTGHLSLVCGGCGCWCDDIRWSPDRPQEFGSACELGHQHFQHLATRQLPTSVGEAQFLAELSEALRKSRRPLVTGLHFSSLETQRQAIAIADGCRGVVDPFLPDSSRAKTLAFQQTGEITATWGEVKNRADLVIYWRCHPDRAPRFRQRYGDMADGEFVHPASRTVMVVDSNPEPARWQDNFAAGESPGSLQFVTIDADDRGTLEQMLTASKRRNSTVPPGTQTASRSNTSPNETDPVWWPIHVALSQSRYAAVVLGELNPGTEEHHLSEWILLHQLLQQWTATWNYQQRCVVVPFPGMANQCRTAQSVLTWRTGYPMAVDFSNGFPRYDPIAFHWRELIKRDDVDLILHVSGDCGHLSSSSWADQSRCLAKWANDKPLWEIGTQQTIPTAHRFLSTYTEQSSVAPIPRTIGRPDAVMLPYSEVPFANFNREAEIMARLWSLLHPSIDATP
jgi:formylmethanofuran dehydrogenase subunit B